MTAYLLLLTVFCGAQAPAQSDEIREDSRWEPWVGTWEVQEITFECATGISNPPFDSLLTSAAHGTPSGTTANPVLLPGQRSSEQGLWRRVGENHFTSATEAFIELGCPARSMAPAFVRGSQRIQQSIELTGEDTFTSNATLTFFDESEAVVASGCATAKARRLTY